MKDFKFMRFSNDPSNHAETPIVPVNMFERLSIAAEES